MKTINNELIRSLGPCYDPSEKKIPDDETLSVPEWVEKYRSVVSAKDIIWLLCRNAFLSDRDLRLFAVWCAREALSLIDSPDPRGFAACDVAERFANGNATNEELRAARADAEYASAAVYAAYAAREAADYAAYAYAAYAVRSAADAATDAATDAAHDSDDAADAVRAAAREKQLNQLLTYFNYETNNN